MANRTISELLKFTQSGDLSPATAQEIHDALVREYKYIYGNDIELSEGSADEQFIYNITLIINNILQSCKKIYDNLNPNTATGKYLDILSAYNNIERIGNTAATCQIYVKNITSATISASTVDVIAFQDNLGNSWTWNNPKVMNSSGNTENKINFPPDTPVLLTDIVCDNLGAIGNPTEMILIDIGRFEIVTVNDSQIQNFINGTNEETDAELRSRRLQSLGSASVSILSGLKGALLNIDGIEDCWIYNNNINDDTSMNDGSEIGPYSIYIALRYKDGFEDDSNSQYLIGSTIYNKLTPGVGTNFTTDPTAGGDKITYTINKSDSLKYNISWKKCSSTNPSTITVSYKCSDEYPFTGTSGTQHTPSNELENNIANSLINYLNKINIGAQISQYNIQSAIMQNNYLDNRNESAIIVNSISIPTYTNKITYYKYTLNNIKFNYNMSTKVCTLTIG